MTATDDPPTEFSNRYISISIDLCRLIRYSDSEVPVGFRYEGAALDFGSIGFFSSIYRLYFTIETSISTRMSSQPRPHTLHPSTAHAKTVEITFNPPDISHEARSGRFQLNEDGRLHLPTIARFFSIDVRPKPSLSLFALNINQECAFMTYRLQD